MSEHGDAYRRCIQRHPEATDQRSFAELLYRHVPRILVIDAFSVVVIIRSELLRLLKCVCGVRSRSLDDHLLLIYATNSVAMFDRRW
jgi:hypothetical protein